MCRRNCSGVMRKKGSNCAACPCTFYVYQKKNIPRYRFPTRQRMSLRGAQRRGNPFFCKTDRSSGLFMDMCSQSYGLRAQFCLRNSSPGTRLHFRLWRKLMFRSVQPSRPTVPRTVGFDFSSPTRKQKSGCPYGLPFKNLFACFSSTSVRMRPQTKGLSHGLKIARLLSIFTPVCALVSPFRVPREIKNPDAHTGIRIFGGSPGTRTLDPRLKRALLYQLS